MSTTTAVSGAIRTTSPSPCPTSQATSTQPRGGQPGDAGGPSSPAIIAVASRRTSHGRASTPAIASPPASAATESQASMAGVVGHGQEDPGSKDP